MKEVVIRCKGHPNVRATHPTTLEVTRDNYLTPRGDCIVGICADKGLRNLPEWLKAELRRGKRFRVLLECPGIRDELEAWGHPSLSFEDERAIVLRKSSYICGRTLGIRASKAAKDLRRDLVEALQQCKTLVMRIRVEEP